MGSRPQSPGNNGSRHARDPTCISSPTPPVAAAHAGQQRPSCRPTSPRVTLHARFDAASPPTSARLEQAQGQLDAQGRLEQAHGTEAEGGSPHKTSRWALDRWGVTEHVQHTLYPRHLQPIVVTASRRRPNTAVASLSPRGRNPLHARSSPSATVRGEGLPPPVTKGTTGSSGLLTSVSPGAHFPRAAAL